VNKPPVKVPKVDYSKFPQVSIPTVIQELKFDRKSVNDLHMEDINRILPSFNRNNMFIVQVQRPDPSSDKGQLDTGPFLTPVVLPVQKPILDDSELSYILYTFDVTVWTRLRDYFKGIFRAIFLPELY